MSRKSSSRFTKQQSDSCTGLMQEQATHFRPDTPESPLTSSLDHATATVDDLTLALANFSRVPSPEPPSLLNCCCSNEDCENLKAWLAFKSNSESRLILSAEVGQALLQRHEAYVRRHEGRHARRTSPQVSIGDVATDCPEPVDSRVDELLKENAALEKRLNQALVNNDVSEISSKTVLHELQEARTVISRLTVHHARAVGLDTRLMAVMQEKEDMQQERDSEAQRARLAESRISALKERTSKLQQEVRHLQEDLEQRRMHRIESSESILQEARARLDSLQHSQLGQAAIREESEVLKVLESLVEDNDILKRDNLQLQSLLAESREDLHALQEEVEEQRANPPVGGPQSTNSLHRGTMSTSYIKQRSTCKRRPASLDSRARRVFEPLTPETNRRPLSPMDSLTPSETKWTAFTQPQASYPASEISFDIDLDVDDQQRDNAPLTPERTKAHKQLFLLSRSRGVQTDGQFASLTPSPQPSYMSPLSLHEVRSDSSSVTDSQPSTMSVLVERIVSLSARMVQADALTLTNRLKRQHLQGADLGHLSRSTVNTIVSEVSNLRTQFRALLEDDKITTTCTRKDLRGLFKLFRDTFVELGEMRVTLNDVILDPSVATKVSELALNPSKGEAGQDSKNSAGGWMAPISKLFGSPGLIEDQSSNHSNMSNRPRTREGGPARQPTRVIPKLGPALSASATTVKVEFSGTGVGKSVTSTFSAQPSREMDNGPGASPSSHATPYDASKSVMGIFAGAPRNSAPESWVVLPKSSRKVSSRNLMKPEAPPRQNDGHARRLSRNVDAVIDIQQDEDEPDFLPPLLERTLRKRGLSDSSMHSTFTSHGGELRQHSNTAMHDSQSPRYTWADRNSVFQALSRGVRNLKLPTPSGSVSSAVASESASEARMSSPQSSNLPPSQSFATLLPSISSWAGVGGVGMEPFHIDSAQDEAFIHRGYEARGRDY